MWYISVMMQRVTIYTDGACRKNPGPGGWAAVLIYGSREKRLSGSAPSTTNNRMEMMAAIEALNALTRPCAVELFTDSEYLQKGIHSWLPQWKKRGFRTREGEPVKNQDLWEKLEQAASQHKVEWKWVRGHAGNHFNELCDQLAREALEKGLNPTSAEAAVSPLRKETRTLALPDGSPQEVEAEIYSPMWVEGESRQSTRRMKRSRGLRGKMK
jgi:ribonuclease HI